MIFFYSFSICFISNWGDGNYSQGSIILKNNDLFVHVECTINIINNWVGGTLEACGEIASLRLDVEKITHNELHIFLKLEKSSAKC